jgi:hypothetical protein
MNLGLPREAVDTAAVQRHLDWSDPMANWEYKVVYVDFRGRISSEGAEYIRQGGEHRTGFVRGYLDKLGEDGWELTGMLPLLRPESSYFVLKRTGTKPAGAEATEG